MCRSRRCHTFGTRIGQIMKTYDYINHVVIMLPLSVYEGTWTHSPLSLLCITMILCVRRKILKLLHSLTSVRSRRRTTTSTVLLNTSASGLRVYVDTLYPLVAMHLLDRSCLIVGFFLKCYVPCRCQNRRISGRGSQTVRLGGW